MGLGGFSSLCACSLRLPAFSGVLGEEILSGTQIRLPRSVGFFPSVTLKKQSIFALTDLVLLTSDLCRMHIYSRHEDCTTAAGHQKLWDQLFSPAVQVLSGLGVGDAKTAPACLGSQCMVPPVVSSEGSAAVRRCGDGEVLVPVSYLALGGDALLERAFQKIPAF